MQVSFTLNFAAHVPASRPPLWKLKHHYEGGYGADCGGGMTGCPEVVHISPDHYSWLTQAWQKFWFWGNGGDWQNPTDKQIQAWSKYTQGDTAFTDFKGTDVFHDYIRNLNTDQVDPKKKALTCNGNVVTGYEGVVGGQNVLFVKMLNWADGPDYSITPQEFPWFWHHAVNFWPGEEKAYPFTHFGGRYTGIPVLHPFVGQMGLIPYYPMKYVMRIPDSDPIPNPYNPVMEPINYQR